MASNSRALKLDFSSPSGLSQVYGLYSALDILTAGLVFSFKYRMNKAATENPLKLNITP